LVALFFVAGRQDFRLHRDRAYAVFARQIRGFVTMGKLIDEAGTALALCAEELRRVLRPEA